MNIGILITGGMAPKRLTEEMLQHLCSASCIVCADSGYDWAKSHNIVPDILVGDFDSIQSAIDDSVIIQAYPVDKDYSDSELAFRTLTDKKCEIIIVFGGGGGRMDHFLSLHALFTLHAQVKQWYTDSECFLKIDSNCQLFFDINKRISIFPIETEVSICHSSGLKWELDSLMFSRERHSLSNLVVCSPIRLEPVRGTFIAVYDIYEDRG